MNEYARLSLATKRYKKSCVTEGINLFTLIGTCPLAAFYEIQGPYLRVFLLFGHTRSQYQDVNAP